MDATGKEIVIGKRYGYSRTSTNTIKVVIGTVDSINGKKVKLINCFTKEYWDAGTTLIAEYENQKPISISTLTVFPIND